MKFLNALLFLLTFVVGDDLYDRLHVSRSATNREIKAAYRREATKWHPDKNPSKEAEKNFIEATKAYEILSSPEKRAKYDAYGIVDLDVDDLRSGSVNDPSFGSDLFANIFGGYHRPFDRFRESANVQVVTFHNYKVNYHPASRTTPLMLLGISHFCFICRRIQPLWSKIASQYSNLGVTFGVANIQDDQALREELNVLHSPSVVAVIDGKVNYFMGMDYTESSIVDFLVQSLLESSPSRSAPMPGLLSTTLGAPLFTIISNEKVLDNFLMDWLEDSRPRALFFKSTEQPPLRFCLAAFRAADFHASGYVNSHLPSAKSLLKRFNLSQNEENILIFHESPQEPVISQAAVHLSRKVLDDVLMQNSRLSVPRILSSVRFLDLCPADGHPPSSAFASAAETDGGSHTSHRHLCFVLLLNHRIGLKVGSKQRAWLDLFRSALVPAIPHALTSALGLTGRLPDDFRPILSPAYMFSDRQAAWLKNVTASSTCPACLDQIQATAGYILALWRLSSRTLAFRLLPRQMGLHPAEVLPANLTVDAPSIEVYTGRLKTSLTNLVMDMVKVDAFLRGRDAKEVKEDVSGWSIAYLPRMEVLLRDELAASLGVRIKRKLWSMGLAALSYFDRFWSDPIDFLLTSGFTFVVLGVIAVYRVGRDVWSECVPSTQAPNPRKSSAPQAPLLSPTRPLTSGADCGSVLLTPSTYERLVPGAPPGQVSVILCTDASPLGQRLANQFFQISRRMGSGANVRIVPASLFVDHYPEWLGWALEAATRIPFTPSFSPRGVDAAGGGTPPATLTFNPANCRGTVFAVNGFRRYFHMYHPLLPGSQSRPFVEESDEVDADVCCAPRGPSKEARRFANFNKLLGLSHSDNESDYETESETEEECLAPVTPLLEQELLAGLVAWFDRLFEGSLRRHHVSEWPRSLTLSTK
uniref:J domain-containing protein n=3 Tax=Mesocestoides corti TaxID=53468 RepID=A0A5K3EIF9_MESCO